MNTSPPTVRDADPALDTIRRIYARWGRHPTFYAAQDLLTFLGRHRTIRRAAAAALGVKHGDRVLEMACGTGRNFRYLVEQVGPEGEIVGLDYSTEMLAAARRLVERERWTNIRLIQGDSAAFYSSEQFDGVLCVLGMSAMPHHLRALECCNELLRPSGSIVVCDGRPFEGRLRALTPLLRALYSPTTGWVPERDLPADLRSVFGNVEVESYNLGSFFVARSVRHVRHEP